MKKIKFDSSLKLTDELVQSLIESWHLDPTKIQTADDLAKALSNPIDWAEAFLRTPADLSPFRCNYVQHQMLGSPERLISARVHRRGGKTIALSLAGLFAATTKSNYKVIVVCPDMRKVTKVMNDMRELLATNPMLQASAKSRQNPQSIEFKGNGSSIEGFTTGTKSGDNGQAVRGYEADLVIIDEANYLEEGDWQAVMPIITGDRARVGNVKAYAASTTKGGRGRFYSIDTDPSHGWHSIHIPVVNNPEYTPDMIAEARRHSTEFEWTFEWLVDWGELEGGVVPLKYIDSALSDYNYNTAIRSSLPKSMGIDMDKYQWGCEIVVVEYDEGIFRTCYRETIPKSEFTLFNAVRRIYELNTEIQPEFIRIDTTNSDLAIETLHQYGMENNDHDLVNKARGVHFGSNEDFLDPFSKEVVRKNIKELMVNTWVKLFEEYKIELSNGDDLLLKQLRNYRVVRFTSNGVKYVDKEEHAVDAFGLAIYPLYAKYNAGLHDTPATNKVRYINIVQPEEVKDPRPTWGNPTINYTRNDSNPFSRSSLGSRVPSRAF